MGAFPNLFVDPLHEPVGKGGFALCWASLTSPFHLLFCRAIFQHGISVISVCELFTDDNNIINKVVNNHEIRVLIITMPSILMVVILVFSMTKGDR